MSQLVTKCQVCKSLVDEEDLFCPGCGCEIPPRHATTDTERSMRDQGTIVARHHFECTGCGASMSYDPSAQTLRCPFCGNEKLDRGKDQRVLKPSGVIAFTITKDQALAQLSVFFKRGFWRPDDLAQQAKITQLTAVYVPYWTFSARTYTNWTADSSATPSHARGNWLPMSGEHRGSYRGILVGASGVLTPAETAAICPYDLSKLVDESAVDLENAVYEPFQVQRKYARPLAQQAIDNIEAQACRAYVPGECRNMKVNVRLEGLAGEPILLPVWIMAYRYGDEVHRFLVNGQSGRCTGTVPTSKTKVAVAFGIALLVVLAIVVILFFLSRM